MPTSYKTRFLVARQDIEAALDALPKRVFTQEILAELLEQGRQNWRLGNIGLQAFSQLLEEHSHLNRVSLRFPTRPTSRLLWRATSNYEIVQSLNEVGYFSHYSAIHLHELTEQVPKMLYFNVEQNARPGGGVLDQSAIARVFRGKCRLSSRIAPLGERAICMLNGGNTDYLGIESRLSPESNSPIRVSNLERTLIDATVRPAYAGGVFQVLESYQAAKPKVSINRLVSYLSKINYTYPYHQAVGFYMQRAGYRPAQLNLLDQFPIEFDFYLDYDLKNPNFDSRWRIYIPQGL